MFEKCSCYSKRQYRRHYFVPTIYRMQLLSIFNMSGQLLLMVST